MQESTQSSLSASLALSSLSDYNARVNERALYRVRAIDTNICAYRRPAFVSMSLANRSKVRNGSKRVSVWKDRDLSGKQKEMQAHGNEGLKKWFRVQLTSLVL